MKFRTNILLPIACLFAGLASGQNSFLKTYGGPGDDFANYLLELSDGYLVAGATNSFGDGSLDGYLLRLQPDGDIIWQKAYGSTSNDVFNAVTEANDGGYLAVGNTTSGFLGSQDIMITRVDDFGNVLWSKISGGGADDYARAVIAIGDGYIISGGQSSLSAGTVDGFIMRINNVGDVVWTNAYAGSVSNILTAEYEENGVLYVGGGADAAGVFMHLDVSDGSILSAQLADGSSTEALYFIRPTSDNNLVQSDHSWSPSGGTQIRQWTRKIDKSGNVLWSKVYAASGANLRGRTEPCLDGGFLIVPYDNFVMPSSEPVLIRLDSVGNVLWSYQYGGAAPDRFIKGEETSDGGFIATGQTRSVSTFGDYDILLVKTSSEGLVEGCCIAPYPVTAEDYNPAISNFAVSSYPFIIPDPQFQFGLFTLLDEGISCFNPSPVEMDSITFCAGDTVLIGGEAYTDPGEVQITLPGANGCDTLVFYTLIQEPLPVKEETIALCEGESVVIGGNTYIQNGTVVDTLAAAIGCDTVVTYTLIFNPLPTRSETIERCVGESIAIGGNTYTQNATVNDTLSAVSGCDTVVTYTLIFNPLPTRSETIERCVGESVAIGGNTYTQSGTVVDTLAAVAGCDTVVTYTLTFTPLPTRSETVEFCPGSSVVVNGVVFTQPGITTTTLPSATDCDTVLTYVVQYYALPQPSTVSLNCPAPVTVDAAAGADSAPVIYATPSGSSDCVCGGYGVSLLQGLPSGSQFLVGTTQVCYQAADSCGTTNSCCFQVTVNETEAPCDVKINGCVKFELLSITADPAQRKTYRIRVTNNCANKMMYFAAQVPNGMTAVAPANNAIFSSEGGRDYVVRNPNFSPFYSIKFTPVGNGLVSGQSDIFKYTLPVQASSPWYIHTVVRLQYDVFIATHLNTFFCPIGVTPPNAQNRSEAVIFEEGEPLIYPNPASDFINIDLTTWPHVPTYARIFNAQGRLMLENNTPDDADVLGFDIPTEWPDGVYFLEINAEDGAKSVKRFVKLVSR